MNEKQRKKLRSNPTKGVSPAVAGLAGAAAGFLGGMALAVALGKRSDARDDERERELKKRRQANLLKHMASFLVMGPWWMTHDDMVNEQHTTFASLVEEARKLADDGVIELDLDARDASIRSSIKQIYCLFTRGEVTLPYFELDRGKFWLHRLAGKECYGTARWLFLRELSSGVVSLSVLDRIAAMVDPSAAARPHPLSKKDPS